MSGSRARLARAERRSAAARASAARRPRRRWQRRGASTDSRAPSIPSWGRREATARDGTRAASLVAGQRIDAGAGASSALLGGDHLVAQVDFYEDGDQRAAGRLASPDAGVQHQESRTDSKGMDEVLLGGLASLVYRPAQEQHPRAHACMRNQSAEDEARFQVKDAELRRRAEPEPALHRANGRLEPAPRRTDTAGSLAAWRWTVAEAMSRASTSPTCASSANTFDHGLLRRQPARQQHRSARTRAASSATSRRTTGRSRIGAVLPFRGWTGRRAGSVRAVNRTAPIASTSSGRSPTSSRPSSRARAAIRTSRRTAAIAVPTSYGRPAELWTDVFLDRRAGSACCRRATAPRRAEPAPLVHRAARRRRRLRRRAAHLGRRTRWRRCPLRARLA